MPGWRLQLHGAARLLAAESATDDTLPLIARDAAWLALVALGGGLATERIAAMVWPRPTLAGSLLNLRTRVKRLRERAGARLVTLGKVPALHDDLTLAEDEDAELLPGLEAADMPEFADWLAAERRRRDTLRRDTWAAAAEQAEAAGHLATALGWAGRLCDAEPTSEHAARRLMRLHHRRGDRAAAVLAFERLAARLDEELGLEPGTETLRLHDEVLAARPAAAAKPARAPMPASLHRPPRTIGRDAELQCAQIALRDGRAVVLEGEAGIGKTRLLDELAAVGGAAALRIATSAADAAWPGRMAGRLVQVLTAAAPDLQPDPALAALAPGWRNDAASAGPGLTAASPELLAKALVGLVQAVSARGLGPLLLDDLHHADAASAEILLRLLDDPGARAIGWVIALRPQAEAPLHAALCGTGAVEWITLAPLTPPAVAALLESLALQGMHAHDLAGPLVRRVGRNPQHLLLALMAWWHGDDLDDTGLPRARLLADRLRQRLAQLSPAARELVRVAAVAAPDFTIELAAAVTRHTPLALADPWHELEAAGILNGEDFAHDLMHEAVLSDLPQPVARHLHGSVASWLSAQGNVAPEAVARHWQAGGETGQAGEAWRAVADRASWLGRKVESAELLLRAAACFQAAGQSERAAAAAADAVDNRMFGDSPEAALALAEQWLARVTAPADRACILASQAQAAFGCGRVDQAIELARAALEDLPAADDLRRMHASFVLAYALGERGDAESALALLAPWVNRVDALAGVQQRLLFWAAVAVTSQSLGRLDEAAHASHAQLSLATEHGAREYQITAQANLFAVHSRRGDGRAALASCEAAERLMAPDGEPATLRTLNRANLGLALAALGRLGDALAVLEAAAADTRLPAALMAVVHNTLAQVLTALGQPAKARAWIADPLHGATPVRRASRLLAQAQLARALGGDEQALLAEALALCDGPRAQQVRLTIEAERLHGKPDAAAALSKAAALVAEADAAEFHAVALLADRRRLDLLRRAGEAWAAAQLAGSVRSRVYHVHSVHFWLPDVLEACALAFLAAGNAAETAASRASAWHWLRDVALVNVPPAYRHSFLERIPLHCMLKRHDN